MAAEEAPTFGAIPTKQLKIVFKKYVDKSTATTSKTAGAGSKPLAGTCTSVGTLLEKCVGKKYKDANDSIVFKKYTDKTKGSQTFGKLKVDTFCMKEFWLELEAVKIEAEKKVKKPPHDDPDVVASAKQTMAKVASFHAVDLTTAKKPTGGTAGAVTDRLTDPKKYTGSHKERFDESGKGRGAAGRKDLPSSSGYVASYKGEGSHGRGSNPAQKTLQSKSAERSRHSKSAERSPHSKSAEKSPKSKSAEKSQHSKSAEKSPQSKSAEKSQHSKSAEKSPQSQSAEKSQHSKSAEKSPQSQFAEKSQHSKSAEKSPQSQSAEKSQHSKSAEKSPHSTSTVSGGPTASKTDTGSHKVHTDETGRGRTESTGSTGHVAANRSSGSHDRK